MKLGKSYKLAEFLTWTRRKIYILLVMAIIPVAVYEVLGQKWIAAPWSVAVLLGTAASFIVGFKNVQTYNRTLEAQQVWMAIAGTSRYWGLISRDFPTTNTTARALIYRHLAWLTVLRYLLRGSRAWETANSRSNAEYRERFYSVPEKETTLAAELQQYLSQTEFQRLVSTTNKASQLMGTQSEAIRELCSKGELTVPHHTEMQRTIKDFSDQQSKVERIKNFPYPPQYATINTIFVWSFVALLPFCMVREFDRLNEVVSGIVVGNMAWLAIPFSVLISWMYVSLDQVGESTENPFEGGANDVPIAQICRAVEIELREVLRETDLPPLLQPTHRIIL
jgi:ion channel-forming bestrophin family protein